MDRVARPAALAAILSALAAPAAAADPVLKAVERGRADYERHCAVCHGFGAEGDGPFAEVLTVQPTDLTRLAAANEGRFPFERTYRVIDGRAGVRGHGGPEMPIWGNEFSDLAADEMRERIGPYDPEDVVAGRVLGLVMYLLSIQDES